jgi:hypothetical protein
VDIIKVKELLGHRHVTTTQIYDKRRRSTSESASHLLAILKARMPRRFGATSCFRKGRLCNKDYDGGREVRRTQRCWSRRGTPFGSSTGPPSSSTTVKRAHWIPPAGDILNARRRFQEFQAIRDDLAARREATLEYLLKRWVGIKERLSSNPIDAGVTVRRDFSDRMDEVLRCGDVRIAEEWLSVVEEGLDEGSEMEARLTALLSGPGAVASDALAHFIRVMPALPRIAPDRAAAGSRPVNPVPVDLPTTRNPGPRKK